MATNTLPQVSGAPPKRKDTLPWLGMMLVLTLLAGGAGGFLGMHLVATMTQRHGGGVEVKTGKSAIKYSGATTLQELPPIIANLADPSNAWVRLQASIVIDGKADEKPVVLAAEIAEDFLGYMKTLSVAQIGGASGLQHLREDLSERAQIRSHGHVLELIIETLVVQ